MFEFIVLPLFLVAVLLILALPLINVYLFIRLTEEAFARQLRLLEGRVVPFETFLAGRAPAGSAVLTFDDGERSVVTTALPLLKARGMVGVLFVTTGIGNGSTFRMVPVIFLTERQREAADGKGPARVH